MYVYVYVYVYVYMYMYVYVCIYIYIYIRICICIFARGLAVLYDIIMLSALHYTCYHDATWRIVRGAT